MSHHYNYEDLDRLEVTDYDGLQRWINKMKKGEEEDLSHLIQLHHKVITDLEKNEAHIDWTLSVGTKMKRNGIEMVNKYLNHFSPENSFDFFKKLAKYVAPFDFIVTDEQFPVISEPGQCAYVWRFFVEDGEFKIHRLFLVEQEEEGSHE